MKELFIKGIIPCFYCGDMTNRLVEIEMKKKMQKIPACKDCVNLE